MTQKLRILMPKSIRSSGMPRRIHYRLTGTHGIDTKVPIRISRPEEDARLKVRAAPKPAIRIVRGGDMAQRIHALGRALEGGWRRGHLSFGSDAGGHRVRFQPLYSSLALHSVLIVLLFVGGVRSAQDMEREATYTVRLAPVPPPEIEAPDLTPELQAPPPPEQVTLAEPPLLPPEPANQEPPPQALEPPPVLIPDELVALNAPRIPFPPAAKTNAAPARLADTGPRTATVEFRPGKVEAPHRPGIEGPLGLAYWSGVSRTIVKKLRYPRDALQRGVEGILTFRVTIDDQGRLLEAKPVTAGGDASLQEAAAEAIREAAPFAPPQNAAAERIPLTVELPIRFELGRTTAYQAGTSFVKGGGATNRMD